MNKVVIILYLISITFNVIGQIDSNATVETKRLYQYLKASSGKKVYFGHHFTTRSGIHFDDKTQCKGISDVFYAVDDYPAVFSFDFNAGFSSQLQAVKKAYGLGAIITFSFHAPNPINVKGYRSMSAHEVKQVLPGGPLHTKLTNLLDSVANFAKSAVYNNRSIPIIFRPWHEHTGAWFWWGTKSSTEDEFIALWRFTIEYLRDKQNVHNLLYAFSPSKPAEYGGYEKRNPGAEYFDIAGFDCYAKETFKAEFIENCKITAEYANKFNKIPAITEFGYREGLQNSSLENWYMSEFFEPLLNCAYAKQMVYAVTWRNSSDTFWVPLSDSKYYNAFKQFYNHPFSVFLSETGYTTK